MRIPSRRRVVVAVAFAAVLGGAASSSGIVPLAASAPTSCPAGTHVIGSRGFSRDALAQALAEQTTAADGCVPDAVPENGTELMAAAAHLDMRRSAPYGEVNRQAHASALAERRLVAAASANIPGTGGKWTPLGKTPLDNGVADFPSVNGLGLRKVAGRIANFAYDPVTKMLFAAVAQGGVWISKDLGDTWTSIGDKLATQMVSGIAVSPGAKNIVIVTGDNAPGGSSFAGLGAYWSTDLGKTWHKSTGVPDGFLGFQAAIDPTNPNVYYAATGGGLYRSADAGKTFVDVKLPTGPCTGKYDYPCGLANQVTDVVVQAPDTFGSPGGKVMAAVGWRANDKPYADSDNPQAAWNGIYTSDDGTPGSFAQQTGPPAQRGKIGRVELGAATGSEQNHEYVYAIVQDAVKFNGGAPFIDIDGAEGQVPIHNTVLDGLYVSPDWGATWVVMAQGDLLAETSCAEQSALCGDAQVGYSPGVQAWYNEWIQPDPSRHVNGIPSRLTFGLEEVWVNQLPNVPISGPTAFRVVGRYFSDTTCFFRELGLPACPHQGVEQGGTTTHPDQHAGIWIEGPDEGQVHHIVGNDGGVYRQSLDGTAELSNLNWGDGNQTGMNTLLPYHAQMAKDGVVWAGLQDNGHMRINTDGSQHATFGGDGTFAAVDPNDSDVAYEAYVYGAMSATSDGGKTWHSIDPLLTNPAFVTPFVMDPKDVDHIVTGGREIVEETGGQAGDWVKVYDLGTADNPGVEPTPTIPDTPAGPPPVGGVEGIQNRMSAIDVDGANMYAGFCGYCDVLTQSLPFKNGLATNVAGDAAPSIGTSDGWHIAAARGLPNRYITGVTIDPKNPKTVYATLGGYGRRWAPPRLVVQDPEGVGEGHVFKSTDAGESFHDITSNLPDISANALEVRGNQLLVATDFGVFASDNLEGDTWGILGGEFGLPTAPVFSLQIAPQDPNMLVVATYGRGVYTYKFSNKVTVPPIVTKPKPPIKRPGGGPMPATGGLPLAGVALAMTATAIVAMRRRATNI